MDYAPRRGYIVKRLGYKELMDVLELCEVLEFYDLQRYFDSFDRGAMRKMLDDFERTFRIIKTEGSTYTRCSIPGFGWTARGIKTWRTN